MAEPLSNRAPTDTETQFTEALTALIEQISVVQAAAQAVQATGGDAKGAFLATIEDENDRATLAMQWPMFSMMLGLSP